MSGRDARLDERTNEQKRKLNGQSSSNGKWHFRGGHAIEWHTLTGGPCENLHYMELFQCNKVNIYVNKRAIKQFWINLR